MISKLKFCIESNNLIACASYSPDGKLIVTSSCNGYGETIVWEPNTGGKTKLLADWEGHYTDAVFSPDGKTVLTRNTNDLVRIVDIRDCKELYAGRLLSSFGHNRIFVSPDGKGILSPLENRAEIFDIATEKISREFIGHTDKVQILSFSPDGMFVMTSSDEKSVRIWETSTGVQIAKIQVLKSASTAFFSPDGKFLAIACRGHYFLIFDTATWNNVNMPHQELINSCIHASFSPDSQYIATAHSDGTVRTWTVYTKKEILILKGHTDAVRTISISPDGNYIVTTSDDLTVRVWSTKTGKEVYKFDPLTTWANGAFFSPDGSQILVHVHTKVYIWDITEGQRRKETFNYTQTIIRRGGLLHKDIVNLIGNYVMKK